MRLIGLDQDPFDGADVVLRPWQEATQIEELSHCDIGLAPLYDGPWERGKAGLKAIQYMAAGLPVLAAKVGSLPDIVVHGQTGFLYQDGAEFIDFAEQLAAEEKLRMGEAGRLRAASCYSMHQWIDGVQRV